MPHETPQLYYEDRVLKITYIDHDTSDRCLVAFTGVGFEMGGIEVQREEFLSQCNVGAVIWITDKKRSWGNNLDLEAIKQAVETLARGREIDCIGNSMGGFLAILLSGVLNARRVLAFVPQFSVCPTIVPHEERWVAYRMRFVNKMIFRDLRDHFASTCRYAIIMGNDEIEQPHVDLFKEHADYENVEICQLEDAQHDLSHHLKGMGLLNPTIAHFLETGEIRKFFEKHKVSLVSNTQLS